MGYYSQCFIRKVSNLGIRITSDLKTVFLNTGIGAITARNIRVMPPSLTCVMLLTTLLAADSPHRDFAADTRPVAGSLTSPIGPVQAENEELEILRPRFIELYAGSANAQSLLQPSDQLLQALQAGNVEPAFEVEFNGFDGA